MAQWELLETSMWVNIQRITGVAHCANVVWPDLDTTSPHGRLALQMFAALAEYERALIQERIMAGLAAARARGRKGGRKPKLSAAQQRQAQHLKQGGMSITEIAQTLQCSRHTIYAALAQARAVVD